MKIEIWADYSCPFCYIGKKTLDDAIQKLGLKDVEVEIKTFLLDPNAPQTTDQNTLQHLSHKYGVSLTQAREMTDNVTQMAKRVGLTLDFDRVLPTRTQDAHRLTKFALETTKDRSIVDRLYRAYFTEGKNLADPNELIQIAKQSGLDESRVSQLLSSDEKDEDIKKDIREARELGITGVPFFRINQTKILKGAQPLEVFLKALQP